MNPNNRNSFEPVKMHPIERAFLWIVVGLTIGLLFIKVFPI
jgi:hypothetical protein